MSTYKNPVSSYRPLVSDFPGSSRSTNRMMPGFQIPPSSTNMKESEIGDD